MTIAIFFIMHLASSLVTAEGHTPQPTIQRCRLLWSVVFISLSTAIALLLEAGRLRTDLELALSVLSGAVSLPRLKLSSSASMIW